MKRDTAADSNADRTNFFLANPHSRISGLTARLDSKVETYLSHDLFKLRNKTPYPIFM